jgi:apolipoprotein D and lipocalin family protein
MKAFVFAALALFSASTHEFAEGVREPFQKVVDSVDIQKFLGSWYVIALLPTFIEKDATNGIETYSLDAKGNIRVEYVFRKGSPAGKRTVMHQKGWILDKEKNSEWAVQPIWPLRLPYLIIDLAEDYRYTVIGTNNYKYVWIMSRTPTISDSDYAGILSRLADRGYKIADIQRMQQVW